MLSCRILVMGYRLYCWGCGKTFGSYKSLRGHVGRCYWYRWFKENDIMEQAPFYPDNIAASLEFMRGEPVPEDSIKRRFPHRERSRYRDHSKDDMDPEEGSDIY